MAISKSTSSVTDWTAVAQNTIGESGTIDLSGTYESIIHIQAGLDSVTAHTGTRFVVQISGSSSGDEDWQNFCEFVELIGTAAKDDVENNPLNAGETSITLTTHALTVLGKWLLIEDATLINSELVFEVSQTANAVVVLDGVTNAHQNTADIYNIAFAKDITIPAGVYRARVLADNSYDVDGSTLNYKIRVTQVTEV